MTLTIAHRGASAQETENSLAAFRTAKTMRADAVELDVHATSDGALVVHHDPTIGGDSIAALPVAAVTTHRLANGEPVPTLEQALETLDGIDVFVEVKDLDARHDACLFDVLDHGPTPDRYQVHSFDHRIVERLWARRPGMRYGVLRCAYPVAPLAGVAEAGAQALWQLESLIDPALIRAAHAADLVVYAWTVDEPDRMQELAKWGVDGLCTNVPDVAKAVTE